MSWRGLCAVLSMVGLLMVGCSDTPTVEVPDEEVCLDRSDGARYCIDVYEASREDADRATAGLMDDGRARSLPDRVPWTDINWSGARSACERSGKRLCALDEWVDACDGVPGDGGNTYVYGDTLDATRCNTMNMGIEPTGLRETCKALSMTYDQSGNVYEWTGGSMGSAAARGGGPQSSQTHRCVDAFPNAPPNEANTEIGFRCCRSI
ncbi:MAG: SUMF1/EgtB/PvdO family nonheme iron enzyme [Deltaproteobacteria bacterium]